MSKTTPKTVNIHGATLEQRYDPDFSPSKDFLDSMPDLQNSEYNDIPIEFVGIHDFHLPLKIRQKDGGHQEIKAGVTGMVSLEAEKRGINMSRIIRAFYDSCKKHDGFISIDLLEDTLRDYQKKLDSFDAHILINFDYYEWRNALRSVNDITGEPEGGYQYYNITFDVNLDKDKEFKKILWVDYVYSSACPCSTALTIHNMNERNKFGIPHSQRSVARIGVDMREGSFVWIEDILDACREAIPTETLVFCKRIDEQAFSELNGANPIFVEDAIRRLAHELNAMDDVVDYKVICSHQESLHSHDAVAVITKGVKDSIFKHHVTLGEWQSLKV